MRLGIALHALADSYSHAGFVGYWNPWVNDRPNSNLLQHLAPDIGHGDMGHAADWPYVDPSKALRALEAMYEALRQASPGNAAPPWDEVLHELRNKKFWPLSDFKDGTGVGIPALTIKDEDVESRSSLWQQFIREALGEDVQYRFKKIENAPADWRLDFELAIWQQRRLVLGF
jgi:hypothetical protein